MKLPSQVILAVASPPGRSLRGIIRISGAQTFELLRDRIAFHPDAGDAGTQFKRGAFRCRIALSPFGRLDVWTFHFRAPHSYTGENSAEIQLPGSPILLVRVIDALLESAQKLNIDARRANPGEFTARAFLNSKLSLTQAEGVAATIAAQSDAELRAAQLLLRGSLGDFAHELADQLASALALVEAGIDFTDQDDVVAISPADLYQRLIGLHKQIGDQLRRAVGMEQLRAVPWVVLVGEPNAGKSALFNALLGRERAVVSPISGTTRDVLTEPLIIPTDHGPAEVMLVDLAGLDDETDTTINRIMQDAARQAIDRAELILYCVPAGATCDASQGNQDEILVRTKLDLTSEPAAACGFAHSRSIAVSSMNGQGLADLKFQIATYLASRAVSLAADATALWPRHEAALRSAVANLNEALELAAPIRTARSLSHPELIAASMRSALNDLAALAGDITPDDVLGRVFATFCVGK